jgi:CHAT domain-containing protein
VLSSCATAVASHGLDDPESLVRVFLGAGVPHVVASDWQVDSRATEDLMQAFYERLIRGDSVSAALASAERAIRSRQETSQPYYWAAFAQFGR